MALSIIGLEPALPGIIGGGMTLDPAGERAAQLRARHRPLVVAGLIAVLLVGVLAVAVFVASEGGTSGLEAQAATSSEMATLPQTIPMTRVAGHLAVDAILGDDDEPLAFMLDTGAPVVFAQHVVDQHGGAVAGAVLTTGVDGTARRSDVVPIEALALGEARFRDVAGIVGWVDQDNPLACVTTNGLLGANLMKDAVWQIDYQASVVTIAPDIEGLDHVDGAIALGSTGSTPTSPSPVLELPIGDGEMAFLLDTGSDGALTLHPADLTAVGLGQSATSPTVELVGAGAGGSFATELVYVDVELRLGGSTVTYPVATSEALAPGLGNIGNAFLRDFVVTIDWPRNTIYLDPVAPAEGVSLPSEPASAGLTWDGEHVTVGAIVKGGSADEAGLDLGTVISTVDGRSYENATFDDYCRLVTAVSPGASPATTTLVTEAGETYVIGVEEGFFDRG